MSEATMIVLCFLLFLIGCSFGAVIDELEAQKKYEELERKIGEERTKSFYDGYRASKRDAYHQVVCQKLTPNMLREYLGLSPMEEVTDTTEEQE